MINMKQVFDGLFGAKEENHVNLSSDSVDPTVFNRIKDLANSTTPLNSKSKIMGIIREEFPYVGTGKLFENPAVKQVFQDRIKLNGPIHTAILYYVNKGLSRDKILKKMGIDLLHNFRIITRDSFDLFMSLMPVDEEVEVADKLILTTESTSEVKEKRKSTQLAKVRFPQELKDEIIKDANQIPVLSLQQIKDKHNLTDTLFTELLRRDANTKIAVNNRFSESSPIFKKLKEVYDTGKYYKEDIPEIFGFENVKSMTAIVRSSNFTWLYNQFPSKMVKDSSSVEHKTVTIRPHYKKPHVVLDINKIQLLLTQFPLMTIRDVAYKYGCSDTHIHSCLDRYPKIKQRIQERFTSNGDIYKALQVQILSGKTVDEILQEMGCTIRILNSKFSRNKGFNEFMSLLYKKMTSPSSYSVLTDSNEEIHHVTNNPWNVPQNNSAQEVITSKNVTEENNKLESIENLLSELIAVQKISNVYQEELVKTNKVIVEKILDTLHDINQSLERIEQRQDMTREFTQKINQKIDTFMRKNGYYGEYSNRYSNGKSIHR